MVVGVTIPFVIGVLVVVMGVVVTMTPFVFGVVVVAMVVLEVVVVVVALGGVRNRVFSSTSGWPDTAGKEAAEDAP